MNGVPSEAKSDYIHIREAKRILGVCSQTLHSWDKQGKVRVTRFPSGTRYFHREDVLRIAGVAPPTIQKKNFLYIRVSSQKQKDDLERQRLFLRSKYPDYTVVADVGSGINWKRKGLQALLVTALKGDLGELVVAHRDRLCRFGFELLQFIFEQCKAKLTVLDSGEQRSGEQELAEDLLAIVHIYSCRSMGRRRYARAKDKAVPDQESEDDFKEVDGDDQVCV